MFLGVFSALESVFIIHLFIKLNVFKQFGFRVTILNTNNLHTVMFSS